jgi:hypothetical protein
MGQPARIIPKVIPVLIGSVQSAFPIIPTDARRKIVGTTG